MNLYLWTSHLAAEHFPLLTELKNAGFDGVEIPASDYTAAEQQRIRAALADNELDCTMATVLPPGSNPLSDSAVERDQARKKLGQDIRTAAALGAEALIGPIHSSHKVFTGAGPTELEAERCAAFLSEMGELAAAEDIYLAVEPLNRFECYFLNTVGQAISLMAQVAHPRVGILYDTHHAQIEESHCDQAIRQAAPHLGHFHVSESHRGTPGSGSVDWASSFAALREQNYAGWIVIEAFASDVAGIPESLNIWRDCFASKREVYEQGYALIEQHMSGGSTP